MSTYDDAIASLAKAIHRDRVMRARTMSVAEKLCAGGDLFDSACEVTKSGIRQQHPDWTDAEVLVELRRRLERHRALEYRNFKRHA